MFVVLQYTDMHIGSYDSDGNEETTRVVSVVLGPFNSQNEAEAGAQLAYDMSGNEGEVQEVFPLVKP
jgi:hypothetical protein